MRQSLTQARILPATAASLFAVLLAGSVKSGPSFGQGAFDPSQVTISDFSYSGTGCPQGSVASDFSEDAQAMTLTFDQFAVEIFGAESSRLERDRKSCQLTMKLHSPPGWQFSVFYMDFRGFASLDAGTTGIHHTAYKLGAGNQMNLGKFELTGPYTDDYARIEELALATTPWSTCAERRQPLTINTAVAVRSQNGSTGHMTVDSLDGNIFHSYGLAWRACGSGGQPQTERWLAHCKTSIVRKTDKSLVRQIISQGKAANEHRALRLARQRVTSKCARINDRSNGNGRRMCVQDPPVCTATEL